MSVAAKPLRSDAWDTRERLATEGRRRTAVVTGASSGIGSAIVTCLLDDGWSVIGLSRSPVEDRGERFRSLRVVVSDFAALRTELASISDVDAIVHAAGLMHTAPVGALDDAHGAEMWAVHVGAAAVLVDALANSLRDGARIVLIGSRAAAGVAGRSQYAATKSALIGMARSWAAELVTRQITVNVVAPAATATPMLADPNRAATPPKTPPIGRLIAPEEVGELTAFLLGPHAGAITGQHIVICGESSL
jgi:NAD(P)-dependent dehydrogenase (short-subunit alcohol dehydrogenase family)